MNVLAKLRGQTEDTWQEVAEATGNIYSPETIRKGAVLLLWALESGMLKEEDDEYEHLEPDKQVLIEKQRVRDLQSELAKYQRSDYRSEALRIAIREAMAMEEPAAPKIKVVTRGGHKKIIVAFGDPHYGADWKITGLYGETINEYNPEVFEERMGKLLSDLISIMNKEQVFDVVVLMCGDSLDGMLRQSQLMKLRYGMTESCIRYAKYMYKWVDAVSDYANIVEVYNCLSNHSEMRPLGSKRGEFDGESFEKIIMWYLHDKFEGREDIVIQEECKDANLIDVCGFNIVLTHGSDDATISNLAKQMILLYNQKIDFFFCGHKHTEQETPTGYTEDGNSFIQRVPSICGADGFAQKLRKGGRPGAIIQLMEEGYGRRCVWPINL